ncbi:hypothetical protein MKX01_000586 [Papaver californicum]|nr:hypothetical protein MKX01_000586 [Papaver californicum]
MRFKGGDYDGSLLPGLHDDISLNCLAYVRRSDYASLVSVSKRFNSLVNTGHLYGLRKKMGIAEHWMYLVCDLKEWEAFDPTTNKWMTLPEIPCDVCFKNTDKESLAVGTELLVFGREVFDFAIWKYSLITREWAKCQSMNHPRCLFGSGSFGSITIVAGGSDRSGNVLDSAELYDSESGKWEILPNMNCPRKLCSGVFMDGKFYVIGGMSCERQHVNGVMSTTIIPLACGEEFDLQTKKWRKIEGMYPSVSRAAQAPPLVAVVDNQLYAAESLTNMVKKYDKEKNCWFVLGRLPVRADSSNGWGLAFRACGNQLVVVGGHNGRKVIVLHSWSPNSGLVDGEIEWKVLDMRQNLGFVYNCAVMGC